MIGEHAVFVDAIHGCREVRLEFLSKEDGGAKLNRRCAPMDYGPSRRASDQSDRYHLWDFDSDAPMGSHVLSLLPAQIVSVTLLDTTFDPASFVTWPTQWFVPRTTWGAHN